MSIDWLLNDMFVNLDRGYLLEQNTRQQLVNYFNTVIEDFTRKNDPVSDGQDECKQVVQAALKFHEKSKQNNSQVCLMGKYHDLLYVAAKLCYLWDLKDTQIICSLLSDIYSCEKTFEKLFQCAIFGTKVTQLISGWRSDYKTQDENIKACQYFVEHAAKGAFAVSHHGLEYNLVDVPMTSYEKLSPLKVAIKADKWDVANLLMSLGALTYVPFDHVEYEKYTLFETFIEKLEKFYECPDNLTESFAMFLRSVPRIGNVFKLEIEDDERMAVITVLNELTSKNLQEPESLKHLARCSAREYLSKNHLLPARLSNLPVPLSICKYIDLVD
ncbi:uncharacterized protein stops [Planococcus citri]|uniref:uncharacterized protein stops n=1 Tax=Planococcus citri TaxID=170843 RepID=UPI0031F786A4